MPGSPVPRAQPFMFRAAQGWCFAWFHPAAGAPRGIGAVLCRPIGYEAMCTYQTYTQLAQTLAQAGFDVLRFDYHGTGDSSGGDADADRVRAWIASTTAAAAELGRLAGVSRLAFFGVRMGATLAAQAAAQLGGVESLVMWAPCATGRAFARELRAAGASRDDANRAGPRGGSLPGDLEALGYLYTAQTLRELGALDCRKLPRPPARRVLIIGRDDVTGEGPLPQALRTMGVATDFEALAGYSSMMISPHETAPEQSTLQFIASWLCAAPQASAAVRDPDRAPAPASYELEAVRETPVEFGPDQSLVGILCEPGDGGAAQRRGDAGVLMLNVGGNYRIGPNRLHVKIGRSLAAAGYRTLRFDLSNVGDSRNGARFDSKTLYSRDATPDVQSAIDLMTARGCRQIWLVGMCSGSYVAFQAALADRRVTGQILINSRLLERQEDWQQHAQAWQSFARAGYKSTHYYRRALLQPQVYRRLLRGEIDVRGIARRLTVVMQARARRAIDRVLHPARAEGGVLARARQLSARGTETLLISSVQDDGRDYLEFHFGPGGSRMRGDPNFRMLLVEDSDHTFSTGASQKVLIGMLHEHLERRSGSRAGVKPPPAVEVLSQANLGEVA